MKPALFSHGTYMYFFIGLPGALRWATMCVCIYF